MKILYKHVNKYNGICINKYGKYEPFEGSQPVLLRALGVLTSSHPHHKRMKEPPPPFPEGETETQTCWILRSRSHRRSSGRAGIQHRNSWLLSKALASPSLPLRLGCDLLVGDKSVWSVFSGVSKKQNRVE